MKPHVSASASLNWRELQLRGGEAGAAAAGVMSISAQKADIVLLEYAMDRGYGGRTIYRSIVNNDGTGQYMSDTTTRGKHTEAFKRDAVYAMEYRGAKSVSALAKELSVQPSLLYVWQHQYKADDGRPVNETMSAALAALRSETAVYRHLEFRVLERSSLASTESV